MCVRARECVCISVCARVSACARACACVYVCVCVLKIVSCVHSVCADLGILFCCWRRARLARGACLFHL